MFSVKLGSHISVPFRLEAKRRAAGRLVHQTRSLLDPAGASEIRVPPRRPKSLPRIRDK